MARWWGESTKLLQSDDTAVNVPWWCSSSKWAASIPSRRRSLTGASITHVSTKNTFKFELLEMKKKIRIQKFSQLPVTITSSTITEWIIRRRWAVLSCKWVTMSKTPPPSYPLWPIRRGTPGWAPTMILCRWYCPARWAGTSADTPARPTTSYRADTPFR